MSRPVRITATGNIGPATGARVGAVLLTSGTDASSLVLRDGGAGGAIIATIKAGIALSEIVPFGGLEIAGQLHGTLTGTTPEATIELATG